MPSHRRRTCRVCRVLDDALPVDRYLTLSAESFAAAPTRRRITTRLMRRLWVGVR
jgi:hypothetical protein